MRSDEPSRMAGVAAQAEPARPEETLLDSVVAISSNLDVRTVLARLLASAFRVTTAEFGELVINEAGGDMVEVITDTRSRPRSELGDDASFIQLPVRLRGTIVGRMELARRAPFTDQQRVLVEGLASAAGFAIDNARSYAHNERRRQWLEASAWLSEALRPPIDVDVALRRITAVAKSISGAVATAFIQWPQDCSPVVFRTDDDGSEALDGLLESLTSSAVVPTERYDILQIGVGDCRAVVLPLRAHVAAPTALVAVFDGAPTFRARRRPRFWSHSQIRPRWHSTASRRSRTARTSRSSPSGTAFPESCTTWSSSGFSRPGCNCRGCAQTSKTRRLWSGSTARSTAWTSPSATFAAPSSTLTNHPKAVHCKQGPDGRARAQSDVELPDDPSNFEARTAAWVRRSRPSFPRMLET